MNLSEGLADIGSALGALQTASKIIKDWTSAKSEAEKQSKLSELGRQILAAQTSAIQANAVQAILIEEIGTLKAKIAGFETWDAEKQRYKLEPLGDHGVFAYCLKADAEGGEPSHWICPDCYQDRRKGVLQQITRFPGRSDVRVCHEPEILRSHFLDDGRERLSQDCEASRRYANAC